MSYSSYTKKYLPSLTDEQCAALDVIGSCLAEKNKVMNLTALTDEKGVGLLHFWDSLTLLSTGYFSGASVIDIGCGGGFPSLPVALCAPDCTVVSNDATRKKLDFVAETALAAGIKNLSLLPGRAEELSLEKNYRESFDIAMSRGVARLNVLCEWCLPFVKVGGCFLAMKGEKGVTEAEEAKNAIKILGGEVVDIISFNVPEYDYLHTIAVIKKVKNTPNGYPRKNSAIMKKPL